MTNKNGNSQSLCKSCKFRFRRVFIPSDPEEFKDEEGNCVLNEDGENIVIMNMCLVADMDLDMDSTIECTHYEPKEEKKLPFFKHM